MRGYLIFLLYKEKFRVRKIIVKVISLLSDHIHEVKIYFKNSNLYSKSPLRMTDEFFEEDNQTPSTKKIEKLLRLLQNPF